MPSAPGGLQSLGKDSSSKISGTGTSDKHDKRSEKPLVLPPEVSATLEAILESNADGHLEISSSTVRKLAVQSPFSAANGVVETKGRPLKFALTAQYRKPSHPFQVTNLLCVISFARKEAYVTALLYRNLFRATNHLGTEGRNEKESLLCKHEQVVTNTCQCA